MIEDIRNTCDEHGIKFAGLPSHGNPPHADSQIIKR
jgi:hypothetical protein